MAQLLKCSGHDFDSGHDMKVCGIKPTVGLCSDSTEPAWDCLSPVSAPYALAHIRLSVSLCLKIKKKKPTNLKK